MTQENDPLENQSDVCADDLARLLREAKPASVDVLSPRVFYRAGYHAGQRELLALPRKLHGTFKVVASLFLGIGIGATVARTAVPVPSVSPSGPSLAHSVVPADASSLSSNTTEKEAAVGRIDSADAGDSVVKQDAARYPALGTLVAFLGGERQFSVDKLVAAGPAGDVRLVADPSSPDYPVSFTRKLPSEPPDDDVQPSLPAEMADLVPGLEVERRSPFRLLREIF